MMNILEVSGLIQDKIKLLERMRLEIRDRSIEKATTSSAYDKAMAITIIKLKNGQELMLDNEAVMCTSVTLIDKIARGICWKEKLEMDKAEALYKSLISNIDSVQSELNGLQSVNRY